MNSSAKILLTGGAGYIGSHTYVALGAAGFTPVILDNFCNSDPGVVARLQKLTGKPVALEEGDVSDRDFVAAVLRKHGIGAVIHFAALKAVGESMQKPLLYYRHNIGGLTGLLAAMEAAGCRHFVYSGSATVYGDPASVPIREDAPLAPANPYGHTKLIGEQILAAMQKADPAWKVAVLRYFNPVGAHESGLIGEDPKGVPNNLMPYVAQVAAGMRPFLQVFGNDYPTPDGTGIRDYIHVMDLAEGHIAALKFLLGKNQSCTVNLGAGQGRSVLEMARAFERASGRKIPCRIMPRRAGDIAQCYADVALARSLLGWTAMRGLDAMCADAWRWESGKKNS